MAVGIISNPLEYLAKFPLILSFSARARLGVLASFAAAPASGCGRGEGTPAQRLRADSLSQPHPLADAATSSCQLGKPSWRGEGWGEGVFGKAIDRIFTLRQPKRGSTRRAA